MNPHNNRYKIGDTVNYQFYISGTPPRPLAQAVLTPATIILSYPDDVYLIEVQMPNLLYTDQRIVTRRVLFDLTKPRA